MKLKLKHMHSLYPIYLRGLWGIKGGRFFSGGASLILGWFSNKTEMLVDKTGKSAWKGLYATSGTQFAAQLFVKPAVWFARAIVKWRSRSVAKSAYYDIVVVGAYKSTEAYSRHTSHFKIQKRFLIIFVHVISSVNTSC